MDDKRKALYDALSGEYNLGSYEEFTEKLNDENKRKALYDAAGQDFNLGTYEEYSTKLGFEPNAIKEDNAAVDGSVPMFDDEPNAPLGEPDAERGFGAGAREGWKGLKAGFQNLWGETANVFTGSSQDSINALNELNDIVRQGKDVAAETENAWTDAGREIRTGAMELLPGWMIKGWKDRVLARAEKEKVLDDIREALGEAGGDVDKARAILEQRAQEMSYGDEQIAKAAEMFADVKPTEGFGAWVGSNAVQMIPSASALIVGAVTKSPAAAKAIGMIGMGGMTAATAGTSMYEARQAGASDQKVWKVGITDGMIEYLTEKLPFDRYTSRIMGKVKGEVAQDLFSALRTNKATRTELEKLLVKANERLGGKLFSKKNLKDYLADMLAEGASEFSAEALQTMTSMMYENPEDYPTINEILTNGWEGAKAGFFMGAVLGGASKTMEHTQNRKRRMDKGSVDVALVDFGNGEKDVAEVVEYDASSNTAVVLHDGSFEKVSGDAIADGYRFSYEEFENARLRQMEDEAVVSGNVTEGQIQGLEDNIARDIDEIKALAPEMTESEISAVLQSEIAVEPGTPLGDAVAKYQEDVARHEELVAAKREADAAKKEAIRTEIETAVGQRFWVQESGEDDGSGIVPVSETVEEVVYADGRVGYVVGSDESGNLTMVYTDGTKGFSSRAEITEKENSGEILSNTVMGLDDYLAVKTDIEEVTREKARMQEEHALSVEEMIATHPQGSVINVGTEEAKIEVPVIAPPTKDGVIVQMPDGTTPMLTWEDVAHAEKKEITPKTNAQLNQSIVDEYRVAYTPAASAASQPTQQKEEQVKRTSPANPLPLKADGSVDQTALWNKDPEGWAKWNDEKRQDGGADSLAYVTNAIAIEQAKMAELQTVRSQETDFDRRDALDAEIATAQERIDRLVAIQQGYLAQPAVADAVQNVQPELQTEEEKVKAEDQRREPFRKRAKELGDKLGVKINIAESLADVKEEQAREEIIGAEVSGSGARFPGWYDRETGEVTIYLPHVRGAADIDRTVIHEVVAHKGLRGLLGKEGYNVLCDAVWDMMTEAERAKYMAYPGVNGDKRLAADEYIARFAEGLDLEQSRPIWNKIAEAVQKILNSMGIRLEVTKEDLADLIAASYMRLQEQARAAQTENAPVVEEVTEEIVPETTIEQQAEVEADIEEVTEESTSPIIAAAQQDKGGISFNVTTEEPLQDKIRKFAQTEEGKATGWTEDDIESIIAETESLIDAIHRSSTGNEFYDEFAYKEPTIRVDWRDGEAKPIVTWTRANIEYKYDMSADLLCINNEGLEKVLSSDKMVALMEMFVPEKKAKKGEPEIKFTSEDYLELYNTLKDLGFVVPCKGCFDAAGRFKMLPSVAQKFAAEVNALIDERNKDPKAFDEKLKAKPGEKTVGGLPATASTKSAAIAAGVAGDNLTEHVKWTQLMSADGQTKMLSDWGGIFRAWQRTGAGRPKDKLLPEPYYGDIVSSVSTIIGKYGEKTPSFRDTLVNQGTGLRRNSHSEFRPVLAIDEIQFMRDAFIRNLTVFKYMKELDDVRLFGKMGVKFNMSFFPEYVPGTKVAGLDKDGNYIASEESVGSREFPYQGEDGKRHYDGMKGWEEAQKHINKDVSLSSVIFSIPHLLKALTDVPTPSDMRGIWGSLIPFHSSGATTASLAMQGLGMARANGVGHGFSEAFYDYGKGVTNFEAVQNDRFGEGWHIVSGTKAGTDVEPGHKLEFVNGNHYYNKALGVHLFASGYILDSELPAGVLGENGELDITNDQKKALMHKFTIDYNDKVRELKGPYAYKDAADFYIAELPKLGLIPRFDFEVSEEKFLEMCEAANVDPRHPKLGWKGEGNSWSPIDSEAYYSLFCDYGMTDPTTGEWAPHMPVGYVNEEGEREFRLPDNAVEIVKEGLDRFSEVRRSENARIDEAIEAFAERSVEKGRISQKSVDKVLGKKSVPTKPAKPKKSGAIDLVEEAKKAVEKTSNISFSFIGERGAANDKTLEGVARLDNLETARQMESQFNPDWSAKENEAALKIKIATGWERGADGKWRYEVEDVKTKPAREWLTSKKKLTLKDIVEPNPIFDLYPDLLDINIVKDRSKYNLGAYYSEAENAIKLPVGALKEEYTAMMDYYGEEKTDGNFARYWKVMESDILHELQHAIQHREGFAQGGSPDSMFPEDQKRYNELYDEMSLLIDEYNKIPYYDRLMAYAVDARKEAERAKIRVSNFQKAHQIGDYVYKRLAGEVEARNASKRRDLSPEERRNTLLAATEDVARKDQIFLMDAVAGDAQNNISFRMRTDEQREQLFDKSKEKFGLTNNFNAAGYMLPDGSLLDFSEANDGGDPNQRSLDHREIEGIIMDEGKEYDSRWMYLADFMNEGAIRLLPEYAGINLMKAPTKEQRQKLFDFIYKYNGEVILEIADERLNNVAYVEYDRRTSPSRIFRDIDRYFNEGIVPQQSGISFRMANDNQAIFVSNAAKAVEGIKQEKATPEQWLKMIEKNGGLKAGEDKWMGLSDWLKASDKKTLTKQEVLDFINENMIIIEETHYAADAESDAENTYAMIERILQEKFGNYIAEYYEQNNGEDDDLYGGDSYEYAMDKLREEMNDEFPYTIERSNSVVYLTFPYEETDDLQEWADKLGIKFAPQNPINYTRLNYTTDGLSNKHEIALAVPTIESWNEGDEIHFGDAGGGRAVAWIRFGDTWEQRPSPQISRKVLVIDEIQSKRHQEGREKGYGESEAYKEAVKRKNEAKAAFTQYADYLKEKYGTSPYGGIRMDMLTAEEEAKRRELFLPLASAQADPALNEPGIPDAPFDKNWHELAMKRMLRYAAENGYDVIAWTKGEQQADRYNLGKIYNEIEREDNPNIEGRTFSFSGGNYDKVTVNEDGVVIDSTIEEAKGKSLSDLVGKDLAVKMMSLENYDTIDEEDLRIGGEGMKGFYDRMLPAFMNKYGKKWGIKVEDIELHNLENGLTMHSVPVTEEMKASVMGGQVMFRMRAEEEDAMEFTQQAINDCTSRYKEVAEVKVFPANEETAERFGYTMEEMQEIGGTYLKDEDIIAIFALQSIKDSRIFENIFFHESIHKLAEFYPEFNKIGEWMWNNADVVGLQKIKDNVKKAYEQEWHYEEMLAYGIANAMSLGRVEQIESGIPEEYKSGFRQILNEIGYEPEKESRRDESRVSESIRRGTAAMERKTDESGRGKKEEARTGELTAEERRVIGEYFPEFNKEDNSKGNVSFRTSLELDEEFGDAWRNQQNEDGRHSTQVANTKSTYEKIGRYLEDAGMKGASILDASSGLGLGTQALREMGFQVDDVEPFPSENREAPTFSSYADIDGKYDVVISNAVLNVIPDDWRADVLHQMADAVKEGGKMIINTRPASNIAQQGVEGKTRITLDSPSEILVKRGDRIAAYQKGFTSEELAEWIKSELGEGWRVEKATKKNSGISGEGTAVVIKEGDNVSFRVTGTPTDEVVANGLTLTPAQTAEVAANIFAALPEESRKKITDGLNGNILGLKDAILQIPTSLATKENWNEVDRAMADVVAEEMTKMAGEMTRPFSAPEALWLLYNNLNKGNDLISQASRALVQRNLGFDKDTLERQEEAKRGVSFRMVGDATANAKASIYNRGAVNVWTRLKESFVDMQASVEELVSAIEKATGKVAKGFENILLALNQQSSKGLAAMESYEQRFLMPMFDEIRKIMDKAYAGYDTVVRYVILKHGLERNKKLAQRDAKAHYQEIYDEMIAKVNSMDDRQKRTYLTNAQLQDADAKAKLATLKAADTSAFTEEEKNTHKRELAKAKEEAKKAKENLERAQKINSMSEQELKDELDGVFKKIENGTDSVYKELRKNDYSGISSMFYHQLGVNRKDYSTEEEYQAALMLAKNDRFSSLEEVEEQAEGEVESFEGRVDTKELWKRINAATKETLRQQYEANMISKDQYESLRNMFEYYVPLRGFKDNTAEDMYTYYRKPNSTGYTKPILGAEGRKTEAESPFGWIAAMAGSAIASNVKNEAKLALYYFVSNRPENGIATISKTWFVDSGEVDERGKKIFKPAYPPFSEDLSSDAAKQAYEDWQEQMRELQKQGLAYEAGQRLNLGNAVVNISDANKPEHVVTVKVAGKDYTIVINGNPRAAQAINGELNIESTADDYSAIFGPVLRWMSSVNTSYNPEFWITNLMRDMAFTWMAVNTKEDPAYRRKFSKNYRKAFKVISLVAKNEKGTIGNSYIEDMYKDFVKYGGVTGYTQIKDSETWEKEIDNYLRSTDPESLKNGKMMRGMKTFFHAAHRFGESLEQVSRFAAFLTSREMGKTINEAIADAKEITVNFNRKGSGKMITLEESKYLTDKNGQPLSLPARWAAVGLSSIAPLGRRTIMFFNAAVQGLNSVYRLWKKNPKRLAGWTAAYFTIGVLNAAIHALLDDDDDYLDIPQYERRNSLMVGGNGAYLKWALPQEARAFYALGDLAVESIIGRNPHQNVVGEAMKIATEVLPVNPTEGWKAFVPSVAIPAVELMLNEDYKGAPIYNEQKWLSKEERERTAKWSSAYQGTGTMYKGIAQGLNYITGGDKHDAGKINLQPEKMEHLVQSAFGGTIRTADKFINTIWAMFDPEEDVTVRQTPFLNRILTINDERFKNVHVNEVFDYYKADADHALTLEKKYRKDMDQESLNELRRSDEYQWAKVYRKYKKALDNLKEKLKVAEGTAERKELMRQQDELKRRVIKEISEL